MAQGIEQLLKQQKISQAQLARALGYHRQYVNAVARGRTPVSMAFVGRVLAVYGPEAAQLISGHVAGS